MTTWRRDEAEVDTDRSRLDLAMMQRFLTQSYWARGRSLEELEIAVDNSLPFGLYLAGRQVGFARVVTDRLTFAYVADVFVLEPERGRGLGTFLMACVLEHPDTLAVRYWTLFTRDAQGLYRRFGFAGLTGERLARFMIRYAGGASETPAGMPS